MTPLELAERCEQATGPDRELDAEIQLARGYSLRLPEEPSRFATVRRWHDERGECISWLETASEFPPRYTASLDAAMTLVPEGIGWMVDCDARFGRVRTMAEVGGMPECIAETPALALCAAALKARAHA